MRLLPQGISGKSIFILLAIVLMMHMVIMVLFTHFDKQARIEVSHDNMVQKVFDVVYLTSVTPDVSNEKAIAPFQSSGFQLTITNQPEYDRQFDAANYWDLSNELYKDLNDFHVSILLDDGQWLNVHARVRNDVLLLQLLVLGSEIFIFTIVLGWAWSINRFTRPLKNFKQAAERLGVDVNTRPLRIKYGPSIVRETAEAMNKMQQRIQDLIRDRTQMLAAISHDLRTPITRLKLRAQLYEDTPQYDKMIDDLDEMEQMIAQVLAFAKEDILQEETGKLDLVALLQALCDDLAELGHDIELQNHSASAHIIIQGRSLALKRAFTNLINNAVKYGRCARLAIHLRQQQVLITVDDHGPGIPDADLQKVFAPFYRAEPSRSRDTGGVGLGLAVVKEIITAHHGEISLRNRDVGGLRVTVCLPILDSIQWR